MKPLFDGVMGIAELKSFMQYQNFRRSGLLSIELEDLVANHGEEKAEQFKEFIGEMFHNAIVRESNGEDKLRKRVYIRVNLYYGVPTKLICEIVIRQSQVSDDQWQMLRKNSLLTLDELGNRSIRDDKFYKGHGGGLFGFVRVDQFGLPLRLQYERDEQGGMTTTIWVQVDPADLPMVRRGRQIGR